MNAKLLQWCPTLYDRMDCSPPGQANSLPLVPPGSPHSDSLLFGLLPGFASLVAQMVKNLPAVQETRVQFLGREDPLEKGMATLSSILAWKTVWESGGLQPMGLPRVRPD